MTRKTFERGDRIIDLKQRGMCTGPLTGAPAPGDVGLDYSANCRECGKRVKVTVRGLYAHHKRVPSRRIRKTFERGEEVEARRWAGDDWWPMVYVDASDHKNHHWVAETEHPQRKHLVPSRRIRKRAK